jgi:hypothetical protein
MRLRWGHEVPIRTPSHEELEKSLDESLERAFPTKGNFLLYAIQYLSVLTIIIAAIVLVTKTLGS